MSTLEISEIIATGETAGRAVSGIAAAWVNFDGTGTAAIRDSMNVASLTDNGTGDYTVNFSNSMANTNVSSVFGWNFTVGVYGGGPFGLKTTTPVAVGSIRVGSHSGSLSAEDNKFLNVAIHGDLA